MYLENFTCFIEQPIDAGQRGGFDAVGIGQALRRDTRHHLHMQLGRGAYVVRVRLPLLAAPLLKETFAEENDLIPVVRRESSAPIVALFGGHNAAHSECSPSAGSQGIIPTNVRV